MGVAETTDIDGTLVIVVSYATGLIRSPILRGWPSLSSSRRYQNTDPHGVEETPPHSGTSPEVPPAPILTSAAGN